MEANTLKTYKIRKELLDTKELYAIQGDLRNRHKIKEYARDFINRIEIEDDEFIRIHDKNGIMHDIKHDDHVIIIPKHEMICVLPTVVFKDVFEHIRITKEGKGNKAYA